MGVAVLDWELVECADDDVAVGIVGAREEGFAKAGFADGEAAITG